MITPSILALSTGVPEARYSQHDILEHLLTISDALNRRARAVRAVWGRSGVGFRHSVVGEGYFAVPRTTQERNDFYMAEAVPLGEKTILDGLQRYGFQPADIDDFFVVSCTGYNTPGLDLHLAGRLGMRPDLNRTSILSMGCYGAFPGLRRAREAVRGQPGRLALVLALELCSIHTQLDDAAESVVSSALFSDGAAMALVGSDDSMSSANRMPRIVDMLTHCDYTTLNHMSFTLTDHGFRMYLSSYVPDLLASGIRSFVDKLLANNGISREDVRFWGIHPGSTKIVDYVQAQLDLTYEQVRCSHHILYNYGNMSSATILFVLEHIQRCSLPAFGDYGVLLAFGPGLTMESMLVQW